MNLTKILGGTVLLAGLSGCIYTCGSLDINQKELKSPLQDFDGDGKLDVLSCNKIHENGEKGPYATKYEVSWQQNLGEGQLAKPQRLYVTDSCPFY